MNSPTLFFFFKIVSAILCLLSFHVNFRVNLSIFTKKPSEILIGIVLGFLLNVITPEWSHVYITNVRRHKQMFGDIQMESQTNRRNGDWVPMGWARLGNIEREAHRPEDWCKGQGVLLDRQTLGGVFVVGKCREQARGTEPPGWSESGRGGGCCR